MRRCRATLARWCAAIAVSLVSWSTARAGEVTVALERFGALHAFRPGDMTGIRVRLTSSRPELIECIVQWDLENADGDLVSHCRPVTLAPNQPQQRWLYARLPASNDATLVGRTFGVRVFEARDGVRTREVGSLRFEPRDAEQPSQPIGMQEGLIAVIAGGRMGMEPFEATAGGGEVPSMNELTRLALSPRAAELPDRWEGLLSASTIVWGNEGPQSLSPDAAGALLRWIERGGHLVIVLPESGDPWQIRGPTHALAALLPKRGAVRVDALAIQPLLPLLTKGGSLRRGGFHMAATLFDEGTLDADWRTLLAIPEGAQPSGVKARGLVVQRLTGHGRVTIVGLDADALQRGGVVTDGAPQADVFWNPILGRRADAPSESDYRAWQEAKPRRLISASASTTFDAGDDDFVLARIGQTGRATVGVLATLAFFALYWFAAVPGVWLLLRRGNRIGWSWPAFALVALAAAPVAWLISVAFSGSEVQVRHLTVADFRIPAVKDASAAAVPVRVNAWMSVALGGFGTSEVTMEGGEGSQDLLIDWRGLRSGDRRFPDTARGDRAIERSATVQSPARATTTDMQAWWLGNPEGWGRVAWQDESRPVSLVLESGGEPRASIRGALRHGLKRPLRDVQVMLVLPAHYQSRRWKDGPGSMIVPEQPLPPCPVRIAKVPGTWENEALDLGAVLFPKGPEPVASIGDGSLVREMAQLAEGVKPLASRAGRLGIDSASSDSTEKRLDMLSFFQMQQPPEYLDSTARQRNAMDLLGMVLRLERRVGRELDLSGWLVRPCVIVTGFADGARSPIPLRVDGAPATSDGTVMVRLILPLEAPDLGSLRPLRPGP